MTEIRIRNVDPWIVEKIQSIAKKNHRSMENEIKEALEKLASAHLKKTLARLRRLREKQRKEHGGILSDSTLDIRAERDARW